MILRSFMLCAAATALYCLATQRPGLTETSIYGGDDANPPSDAISYGTGDPLSRSQTVALLNLSFPQSYGAVVSRLGYPTYRTTEADYYRLPDLRWVKLSYDPAGSEAIGFQFGNY